MPSSFEHIPHTPRGHLLLHFYAAVDHLLHDVERLGRFGGEKLADVLERYPFLAGYDEEIRRHAPGAVPRDGFGRWWQDRIGEWEADAGGHLPLRALTREAGLDYARALAWVAAGLVDEDSRFGTVFLRMQEPLPHRRPCLETLGRMIAGGGWLDGPDAWGLCQPLLSAGLVEVLNRDAPRSEWVPRVPGALWDAARGEPTPEPVPGCRYHPAGTSPRVTELIFPDAFLRQVEQVPVLLRTGRARAVVLRGTPGSERLEVAAAIAAADGRGVIEWRSPGTRDNGEGAAKPPDLLGPLCVLTGCMPVLTFDLGPGETAELPAPTAYQGPRAALLGLDGGLRGPLAENALTLTLPPLGLAQRLRHWQRALEGHPATDLMSFAENYQLPGGYIRQAGRLAVAQAALHRREAVSSDDVRAACRTLNRQLLDSLAARLDADGSWDELVVDAPTLDKLRELQRRCRHRERLLDRLGPGFGSSRGRGVRALFTGPSGTGKTLAARILAAELGADVYRVDLSAVVNKYIGETEKNLQRVLSRAEELDVILLLDEGDALLGNRTDVKSSNDRYANLETNYLLQRLESYQGIIVVTTNAAQYIDSAFQRRMDVVVSFVPPGPEERLAIWCLHLPADHAVPPGFLNEVAARCTLTGGQVRNAALHATLLALEDGGRPVLRRHLEQALQSEYRKAGALCPLGNSPTALSGQSAGNARIEAFFDALTGGSFWGEAS
jgi:hypothetical protein